ncbi:hypothetical protein ABZ830_36620 [Streptomyces coeruleorubidus]
MPSEAGPALSDRIRAARDAGLRNLPLRHTAQNKIWLEIIQIALVLFAWTPLLHEPTGAVEPGAHSTRLPGPSPCPDSDVPANTHHGGSANDGP